MIEFIKKITLFDTFLIVGYYDHKDLNVETLSVIFEVSLYSHSYFIKINKFFFNF